MRLDALRIDRSSLVSRFRRDQSGSYVIIFAPLMPVLVGVAGLGAEYGLWVYKQHSMLSAADSGAVSAATAGTNIALEANAVTATYGFVNGVNGTTVTVNQPPQSGTQTNNFSAVEVIVQQTQPRLLSALFGSTPIQISGRAVAVATPGGAGCVLALDRGASGAITMQGSTQVNLSGCSLGEHSNSTERWNDVPRGTMDEVRSPVLLDLSIISRQSRELD
jgi:Flp pilus assembly protein TadG